MGFFIVVCLQNLKLKKQMYAHIVLLRNTQTIKYRMHIYTFSYIQAMISRHASMDIHIDISMSFVLWRC